MIGGGRINLYLHLTYLTHHTMRTSVFQYPYEKVFRRTRGALNRLGMRVTSIDMLRGSICAESSFSLSKPSLKMDLIVEEVEGQTTRVTVRGLLLRQHFFQKRKDIECSEAELLEALATVL